jgi:hypothetical protein
MGAEIALTAAAETPLRAVVAEGASVRTWDDFRDQPGVSWMESPPFLLAVTLAGAISDAPEPRPLTELVPRSSPTPLLLISADVAEERMMNRVFLELAGARAELWEIPEAAHTRALALHREEYEARVLRILNAALLGSR